MRQLFLRQSCAGAAMLAVGLSTACLAQTPLAVSRVTITHVKPDMLNEWIDIQKNEMVPALKKSGQKTRTVYATTLFGNAGEFVTISPIQSYAQFDSPNPLNEALTQAGTTRLLEKIRKCTVSSTSFANTRLTDLSNVLEEPPPMIVSVRYHITPGRMQDFENLVKSDILPIYKKAKVSLTVNRRGAGANPNDVTMSTGLTKFADMDGGPFLVKQLGQDGAAKLNAKFTGIRTTVEVVVRRRVPELSF